MTDTIRIGIIATGNMGRAHVRCVNALEGAEVAAIADSDAEMLKRGLEAVGREVPAYDDYRRILDDPAIDAVVISLPNDLHADAAVAALDAGKHVLCEKPMATALADCDRMIAAGKKGSGSLFAEHPQGPQEKGTRPPFPVLQIGLELRCAPNYRELKRLIAAGEIGRLHMLWCHEFRDPFYPKVDDWIVKRARSGGTLVEKDCHHFDLFNWLADSPPVRVTGFGGSDAVYADGGENPLRRGLWRDLSHPDTRMDVLDNAWVIVEYENHARACLGLCMFTSHGKDGLVLGAIGAQGQLVSAERRYEIEQYPPDGDTPTIHRPTIADADKQFSHRGAVLFEHRAFLAAIRDGAPLPVTPQEARLSIAVALAAERAVAEKRVVEIAEIS